MSEKIHVRILDLFVTLLASATISDQITRTFSLNPNVLMAVWLLISFALLAASRSFQQIPITGALKSSTDSQLRAAVIFSTVCAVIFGYLAASSRTSTTYLIANLVCGAIVITSGIFFIKQLQSSSVSAEQASIRGGTTTWVMAFVSACFASVTYRPSTDDHYYVNLSTYIFEKGIIPTRDTVLSNQVFNSYPRISSWEVFIGSLARWIHISPANLLYIIFIPVGAALSIFALAKLFAVSQTNNFSIALISSTVFLITDGANGFTFGNFQAPRIWQGKSLFLAILIPLLFASIISLLQRYTHRGAWQLLLLVIASVGATSTTLIIVPVFLMGAILISLLRRSWKTFSIFGLGFSYLAIVALAFHDMRTAKPESFGIGAHLGTGATIHISGISHSASTVMPSTYELLTAIAKPTWHAALITFCVTFGFWSLREKSTASYMAITTANWALISLPGVHEFVFKLLKAQSIGWRFMWLIPVPFLVGVTASKLADLRPTSKIKTASIAISILILLPGLLGHYPWQTIPGTLAPARIGKPITQRVGFGFPLAWKAIVHVAQPGDRILARNGIGASLAATTTQYFAVSPRDTYVRAAAGKFPDGFVNDRIDLTNFVMPSTQTYFTPAELQQKLDHVRVNVVCLPTEQQERIKQFTEFGYTAKEFTQLSKADKSVGFWCGRTDKYNN